MTFRMKKQDNSTYFRNVKRTIERISLSNIFQTTAARMSQVSKVVAPTSQQALISHFVSSFSEYKQTVLPRPEFFCMRSMRQRTLQLMISLFTFSKERLILLQNVLCVLQTRHGFSVESSAPSLMSEKSITGPKGKCSLYFATMTFYIQLPLLPNMYLAIANTF